MSASLHVESLESRFCLTISFLPAMQSVLGGQTLVASGDVSGDLRADLIAKGADGKVRVFHGLGDGKFAPQPVHTLPAGPSVTGIALGDFNRDGMLDLAISNGGASSATGGLIAIFRNLGNGGFSSPSFIFGGADSRALAATDFNRDGKLDLMVANGAVWSPTSSAPGFGAGYLVGRGDGTFINVQRIPLSGPQHLVAVPPAVNATSAAGANIGAAFGGPGSNASPFPTAMIYTVKLAFTNAFPIHSFVAFPGDITGLAVGDLNRDGKLDLAAAQKLVTNASFGDANVFSFLATNTGFSESDMVRTDVLHAAGLSLADFDRNGKLDVAVTGEDGDFVNPSPGPRGILVALPGIGDGTFAAARSFRGMHVPVSQCLADLNRDGRIDVVTGNPFGAASLLNHSSATNGSVDRGFFATDDKVEALDALI